MRPGRAAAPVAGAAAAPRPRFTSRAAVLVLVLAVLLVSYASSLRAYVEQRRHVASLKESIVTSQDDIEALQREKTRWRDPAYVVAQARARFAFGFPGEIGYQVLDVDGEPLDHEDSLTDRSVEPEPDPQWWQATLTSIDAAGNPTNEHRPEPVTKITIPQDAKNRG